MTDSPRVLLHNDATDALAKQLLRRFPNAIVEECNSYTSLPDVIKEFRPEIAYTVRFSGTGDYPRDAFFADGGPRWIANGGVGIDHFGTWDTAKTTVTNTAGVAAEMMAEYVIGGFLHFTLGVDQLHRDKAERAWKNRMVRPLRGKTLLIVGLGHTGRAVAALAKAFGMRVIGTRANPRDTKHVDRVYSVQDLPSLLPEADFIAVSTPLTPATQGLIGAREIELIKQGAVIADVSRGKVVDQSALAKALGSGQLAGAALDVFEQEPLPASSPLWDLDNVIISPHCSAVYGGWETASFDMFLDNLCNWTRGEALFNVVDPGRGY
jgi:phosphoglycerate dehydrogenase-like enzyme